MLLQTVRPNIVQAIRAYRVEDLMQAADGVAQPLFVDRWLPIQPGAVRSTRQTKSG